MLKSLRFDSGSAEIMKYDFAEDHHYKEHAHQDVELIYVLEGKIQLTVNHNHYDMEKDDIALIESGKTHKYDANENILLGIVHINYQEVIKYINLDHYFFQCNSVIDRNSGYRELRDLLQKIFHIYFERQQEKVYLNSLYFLLLHTIISNFAYKKDELMLSDTSSTEEKRVNEMITYIGNNYQYSISLNDLAEKFNLTTTYLSKYIKKNLGVNFVTYLNQIRLQHACEDMETSLKSLTRIALDNGFPNTAAFSSAFRKAYGENPSVWMKRYQKEKQERERIEEQLEAEKGKHIRAYLEQSRKKTDAEATQAVHAVTADADQICVENNYVGKMINIGSVTSILQSDMQKQLLLIRQELNVEYVRFWDLFTRDMFIDIRKSKERYNFARIDKVLDFLINNGMHPFIELGYKPVVRLRTVDEEMREDRREEREIGYTELKDFRNILYAFGIHCVNRYGLQEVEQWYFEQWGDPRLVSGNDFSDYFATFETVYATIKSISREINVGGAGFGRLYSSLDFKEIIMLWKARKYIPDFISIYAYPYLARSNEQTRNNDRIQDPSFVHNQLLMMRDVMDECGMQNIRLMITEWSLSISDWNSLNDSAYKGAFVLKSIQDNIGYADMMGYWFASDILAEYFDTNTILHGGNGILSVDGIRKPSFYALQFASRLGKHILARSDHAVISTNDSRNYRITCHHLVNPNFRYFLKEENEVIAAKQFLLFDDEEDLQITFTIDHVKNGRYLIKTRSINSENGSVQDLWGQMDYNEDLNRQDIEYLKNISTPKITISEKTVTSNTLCIDTILKPQEIQLIHLLYQME